MGAASYSSNGCPGLSARRLMIGLAHHVDRKRPGLLVPFLLDVTRHSEVMSRWLPLMPIKRTQKMNDLVVVQKIAGWEKLKALVLDSVSSPITKRVYNMALDEFVRRLRLGPFLGLPRARGAFGPVRHCHANSDKWNGTLGTICRSGRALPFVAEVRGQDSSHGAAEGGFCPTTGLSVPNGAGTFLDSNGLGASVQYTRHKNEAVPHDSLRCVLLGRI
jgi:hypothetical protein